MQESRFRISSKDGFNQIITKRLTGELACIILKSDNKIEVNIDSEEGYNLLCLKDVAGIQYLAIKTNSVDFNGHVYEMPSNYFLNEKLIISVNGGKNLEVEVLLRFG